MKKQTFNEVTKFLFDHRYFYKNFDDYCLQFDYPDYLGLPKKLSNLLSPETVDAIQNIINELIQSQTLTEYRKELTKELKRLGEAIQ